MKAKDKKAQAILEAKLKQLYETIRDHKDPKSGRQVSSIFMKLPSKSVSLKSFLKIIPNNFSNIWHEFKIKHQPHP